MSDQMKGLELMPGLFRCKGSGGEWHMWRNAEGFIELYRTRRLDDDGSKHGLERKVTKARTEAELPGYFTPRPSTKSGHDPAQTSLLRQAEELNQSADEQP